MKKEIELNNCQITSIEYSKYWKTIILQWLYRTMFDLLKEFKIKIKVKVR